MNLIHKYKSLMNKGRLFLDKNFYPQYLRNQGVKVGKDTIILYPSYIEGRLPYLVEIGDNVVISLNVTILTHDATTAFAGDMIKVGRVTIGNHCFIGTNSTILCNVEIGENSIVGAGSLINRDIQPNSVFAGNPARFVCSTEQFIRKHKEWGEIFPLFEGKGFESTCVENHKKEALKKQLDKTFGYFCDHLPIGSQSNLNIDELRNLGAI